MSRILLRRGNKVDLPVLNVGEPGFATDTKELFIGTSTGNAQAAMAKQSAWTAPTLLNSVVNFGSGTTPVRYSKDQFGRVNVEGYAKMNTGTTTIGLVIFTLPVGYRPLTEQYYNGIASVSASETSCRVGVLPNGNVIIATAGAAWMTLNGISFIAEQ